MNLSIEDKIVSEYCKAELFQTTVSSLSDKELDALNWKRIVKIITENGISNIFYNNLLKDLRVKAKTPANLLKRLSDGYYLSLRQNIIAFHGLGKVIGLLNDKNVKLIILKGAALAEAVYKDPALRSMTDIDILINPIDFDTINKRLLSIGYKILDKPDSTIHISCKPYLNTFVYSSKGFTSNIHLHWHLVNSSIPTHSHFYKINMDKIWAEAVPIIIGGAHTFMLAPHHMIIHLSEHGLRIRHSFNKTILLLDIGKVVAVFKDILDWDSLVRESTEFNLDRMVYYSLLFCNEYFNCIIPEGVMSRLKPEKITASEKIFLLMGKKNRLKKGSSYLVHFALNKSLFDKSRFIYRTLFPPKVIQAQRQSNKGYACLDRIREVFSHIFLNMG